MKHRVEKHTASFEDSWRKGMLGYVSSLFSCWLTGSISPGVGREHDWGAPGAFEHIKTPIGPWDRWTVSHDTTVAASHLFNLQNDLFKDLFHDKSLFRDVVYRCGTDTAAFVWEPRLTLHPHECDAGCFGLDQALSLLISSLWTELRHPTCISLCGTESVEAFLMCQQQFRARTQ